MSSFKRNKPIIQYVSPNISSPPNDQSNFESNKWESWINNNIPTQNEIYRLNLIDKQLLNRTQNRDNMNILGPKGMSFLYSSNKNDNPFIPKGGALFSEHPTAVS